MNDSTNNDLAIIGMSCRFPGAPDVDAYLELLEQGHCAIQRLPREKLLAAGLSQKVIDSPNYVPVTGLLDGVEEFDAAHFGFSPREAELLDPQYRKLLECSYEALGQSRVLTTAGNRKVGVFATSGMALYLGRDLRTYFRHNVFAHADAVDTVDPLQLMMMHEKDWLPTQISYRLDLTGPSFAVQSACSSSLVALHLASQSLRNGDCEVALVAASAIHAPHLAGYLHTDGSIFSPDGDCRPFSDAAQGIVGGSGVGVIALSRIDHAISLGSPIRAIVKGTAVNNDGARKASFTAPSVKGQKETIIQALQAAGISAADIGLVEAHGTGTLLGDPVEIQAFTQAFAQASSRTGYCALGSVKANIGHLDTAAGMASLIKAVLSLEQGRHFRQRGCETLNPHIDFLKSPFFIPQVSVPWSSPSSGGPRLAMVAALGAGGTNAHAVLSEWANPEISQEPREKICTQIENTVSLLPILTVSAKSHEGLRAQVQACLNFLTKENISLLEWTQEMDRRRERLPYRASFPANTVKDLTERLKSFLTGATEVCALNTPYRGKKPGLVFVYSGQGSQIEGLGNELFKENPSFREAILLCESIFSKAKGQSLIDLMFKKTHSEINKTYVTQPALFAYQFAMTKSLKNEGIIPSAVIGHSIGEYMAAVTAGIMDFEDAFNLVIRRAELMGSLPDGGGMLALAISREAAFRLVAEFNGHVEIAAFNGPESVVVAGSIKQLSAFKDWCDIKGIYCISVSVSHAFHSSAMDSILEPFRASASKVSYSPPKLTIASNLDGSLEGFHMAEPEYWIKQIRHPVIFDEGISTLAKQGLSRFIEIAPRSVLSRQILLTHSNAAVCYRGSKQSESHFFDAIRAHASVEKSHIDTKNFKTRHASVKIPSFEFVRTKHWLEPISAAPASLLSEDDQVRSNSISNLDRHDYFQIYSLPWRRTFRVLKAFEVDVENVRKNIIVKAATLSEEQRVISAFPCHDKPIRCDSFLDMKLLAAAFSESVASSLLSDDEVHIVFLLDGNAAACSQVIYLHTIVKVLLDFLNSNKKVELTAICFGGLTRNLEEYFEMPAFAAARAFIDSVRLEEPECNIKLLAISHNNNVPRRALCRKALETLPLTSALEDNGVILERMLERPAASKKLSGPVSSEVGMVITGAFGGLGLELVEQLINVGAKAFVLIGRTVPGDSASILIKKWRSENILVEVIVSDLLDAAELSIKISSTVREMPSLRSVTCWHLAGSLFDGTISSLTPTAFEAVFQPKTVGLSNVVSALTAIIRLEKLVCFSSVAAAFGAPGQSNYAAANATMEAIARRTIDSGSSCTLALLQWSGFSDVGMAERKNRFRHESYPTLQPRTTLSRLLSHTFEGAAAWAGMIIMAPNMSGASAPISLERSVTAIGREFWFNDLTIKNGPINAVRNSSKLTNERRPSIQSTVCEVVSAIIGKPQHMIANDESFSELGIDSLGVVRLMALLSSMLGTALSPVLAYGHPTIDMLTCEIEKRGIQKSVDESTSTASDSAIPTDGFPAIAVVGAGCRLPGGVDSSDALWSALSDNFSPVCALSRERINMSAFFSTPTDAEPFEKQGSFFEDVLGFDPAFFGITPREAQEIDPQYRLLTEVVFEALEDAGISLAAAQRAQTGLYVGVGTDDFTHMSNNENNFLNTNNYSLLGGNRGVGVGRISYLFGFNGPAIAVDTTCSSSLVAIHQAIQSLRLGEVDLALAGGVNLVLSPVGIYGRCSLGILSRQGECRAFDDTADGFVQGEGCVIVALKRLVDAERDGDEILAVVKGSSVNQNGGGNGLQAPNGQAQERLLRATLSSARLVPSDIDYIEAHGTATRLGDPIELEALDRVFGIDELRKTSLLVGSVKTNFGHLEPAAGALSFLKVALALSRGEIPAQLHFQTPNKHIDWDHIGLKIVDKIQHWPVTGRAARAGVSSFGISGTNAHIILEAYRTVQSRLSVSPKPMYKTSRMSCLIFSAKSPAALQLLAAEYARILRAGKIDTDALFFTAATRRSHWKHRAATWGEDNESLAASLDSFSKQPTTDSNNSSVVLSATANSDLSKPVVIFKSTPFRRHVDVMLLSERFSEFKASHTSVLDAIAISIGEDIEVTLTPYLNAFAIEVAQYRLLCALGLDTGKIIGHGRGDITAAHCAGMLTLQGAVDLLIARERLLASMTEKSCTLSVFAEQVSIDSVLSTFYGKYSFIAKNGVHSHVIACSSDAVEEIYSALEASQLQTLYVDESNGFDNPLIKNIADSLAKIATGCLVSDNNVTFISATCGLTTIDMLSKSDFWLSHLTDCINLPKCINQLELCGPKIVIELGASPFLANVFDCKDCSIVTLVTANGLLDGVFKLLAELYTRGLMFEWPKKLWSDSTRAPTSFLPRHPQARLKLWPPHLKNVKS
ncbi:SDR family NAD(P)-dependent oxidoreductase [Pseudomonas syringae]|uniref:type I polyketide synthase n=1 Tax=Pseudomonas syringae TaxID=317 RepID=UPI0020BEA6DC|nr:type I polyketide synthase [Pseudomonas syringae]MCL6309468.1 SDR family NAD(P)-dependent oxidoreductase [Pseudomonas syringae]